MQSEEDLFYYLVELEDETIDKVIREWELNKGDLKARQAWSVIPANMLIKEWQYNQRTGLTHDKVIEKLQKIVVNNYLKLKVNTVLYGHSELDPYNYAEMTINEEMTREEFEELLEDFEYFACDSRGNWRISDYGIKPMSNYVEQLLQTEDPNKKLYLIDCILNIAHQRSDLASWFVEHGSKTLSALSTGEELTA